MTNCTTTATVNPNIVQTQPPGSGVILRPAPPVSPPRPQFLRPAPGVSPPNPYANCIAVPIWVQTQRIDPLTNRPIVAIGGYFSSNCPAISSNPRLI